MIIKTFYRIDEYITVYFFIKFDLNTFFSKTDLTGRTVNTVDGAFYCVASFNKPPAMQGDNSCFSLQKKPPVLKLLSVRQPK